MPESVSTVDAILDGLPTWDQDDVLHAGRDELFVLRADAVAAVHAAADARTQETLAVLNDPAVSLAGVPMTTRRRIADSLARRFPNGGTDA